jgi:serine/threonine protein phosphatase PrpC
MGSCSICSKSSPRKTIKSIQTHPKFSNMTPQTCDKYASFDSIRTEKRSLLFSCAFSAYGMPPFESEDPFSEKFISYKGKDASYFSNNKISITCRKGLKDSKTQDNFCVVSKPPVLCAGLFTGRGENGHIISALLQKVLPETFLALESSKFGQKSKIFHCFQKSAEKVVEKCEKGKIDWSKVESSVIFAVVFAQILIVGNVGLGQAFVFRRVGERLLCLGLEKEVWNRFERQEELRDLEIKEGRYQEFDKFWKGCNDGFQIEIQSALILNNYEFLVICSQTVVEVIKEDEIGEILEKYESDSACNYIANLVWCRCIESERERFDDITVIILPIK